MQVTSVASHTSTRPESKGMWIGIGLALTCIIAGCDPSTSSHGPHHELRTATLEVSTSSPLPRPVELTTEAPVTASVLFNDANEILQGILSINGDSFLQTEDATFWVQHGTQYATEIEGNIRWLTHAIPIHGADVLLFDLSSVHVLSDKMTQTSPLADSIASELIHEAIWHDETLWLIEDQQLLALANGVLTEVSWPGFLWEFSSISRGPCMGEKEGLWVKGDIGGCIVLDDPDWKLHVLISEPVDSVHTSSTNVFYLNDGTLWKHLYGKFWAAIMMPKRIFQVLSHPESETVWVRDADGWWIMDGLTRSFVTGVPDGFDARGMDPAGSVQGMLPGQWATIIPGPALLINDLTPSDTLYESRNLEFDISPQQEVTLWEVKLNGTKVKSDEQDQFFLDITGLDYGFHNVVITAHTTNPPDSHSITIPFLVERIPTWGTDIQPIYDDKCSLCHDPGVTTFPLHTAELWKYNIEDIELAVDLDVMPLLPVLPLSETQKEMIRVWKIYDFPL